SCHLPLATMTNKTKRTIARIVAWIYLPSSFFLGLLMIYRAKLKTSNLSIIIGEVIDKRIESSTSFGSDRTHCLAIKLANNEHKIAINLGTKRQASKDSAFNLIEIGKTYKFYLDPTVPPTNGINWGICRVDYNDAAVYETSNKLNLYGGTLISIASLIGMIVILKFKKKENGS